MATIGLPRSSPLEDDALGDDPLETSQLIGGDEIVMTVQAEQGALKQEGENQRVGRLRCSTVSLLTVAAALAVLAIFHSTPKADEKDQSQRLDDTNGKSHQADAMATSGTSKNAASTTEAPSLKRLFLYVGVLSAPRNVECRATARNGWVARLRKQYPTSRVHVEFLVGNMPLQRGRMGHVQGMTATSQEVQIEKQLEVEAQEHGDLVRVPVVEAYAFLTDKSLVLLDRGARSGAEYVMKVDDDMQVDFNLTERTLARRGEHAKPLFAGVYLFSDAAYESQKGVDGNFTPYFSGWCYMLSHDLAREITSTSMAHSVAFPMYGSSSEDVDVGRWVKFEDEKLRNERKARVEYLTIPGLCWRVDVGKR